MATDNKIDVAIDTPPAVISNEPERSSSGISPAEVLTDGTEDHNGKVILNGRSAVAGICDSEETQLLVLSAESPGALSALSVGLADFLSKHSRVSEVSTSGLASANPGGGSNGRELVAGDGGVTCLGTLADVASTLQMERSHLSFRRFVVCNRREEAVAALKTADAKRTSSRLAQSNTRRPVIFLLPGVGDQYVGMGRGLYERFGIFRQALDRCAQILQPILGLDIREILYPPTQLQKEVPKSRGIDLKRMLGRGNAEPPDPASQKLDQTIHCHPALFSVEYALAQLWREWGIQPDRIVGHSMGEYVAACLAGVLSLEDALRLVAVRAKLVNELPQAAMLAVMVSEEKLLPLLGENLSISLINGPNLCVVVGPVGEMSVLQDRLQERDIVFRSVRNMHPFHSEMLNPILDSFAQELKNVRLNVPKLPLISNVTGTWMTSKQALDPFYWVAHARSTARFGEALGQLWRIGDCLPLEVGPGRTLGVLAMQHPARPSATNQTVCSSLRHSYESLPDNDFILNSVGQLWLAGVEIDWRGFEPQRGRHRMALPSDLFERRCSTAKPSADIENTEQPLSSPPDSGLSGSQIALPQTPTEVALSKIWGEVLGVKQVGLDDNLFELGGHSLLAIRLAGEIKRQMKINLPIRELFMHPTIGALARVLAQQNVSERRSQLIQLQGGQQGADVFFLIDDGSLGMMNVGRLVGGDWPLYASVALLSEQALRASAKGQYSGLPKLEELAGKHVSLISSRQSTKPIILAGHCFGGKVAFEVAHQLLRAGQKVEAVLLLDAWLARPSPWWWKKTWLRSHLDKVRKEGLSYLWRKGRRRVNLEKDRMADRLQMAIDDDFSMHVPWPIIDRIYEYAWRGYEPRVLDTRGLVFISQGDWASNAFRKLDNTLGAGELFSRGSEVFDVPGDHVTVLDESHHPELAQCFRRAMANLAFGESKPTT